MRAGAHRSGLSLAWDVILAKPWFSHPSAALSRFATLVTCLWYGGVAGDGLRSAEEVTFPIQGRLLYPTHRPPFTGRGARALHPARLVRGPGFWQSDPGPCFICYHHLRAGDHGDGLPRPLLRLLPSQRGRVNVGISEAA